MPAGLVIAKRMTRVDRKKAIYLMPPSSDEGRDAIRMPSDSPSKSWWKIIATRSDAVTEIVLNISIKPSK